MSLLSKKLLIRFLFISSPVFFITLFTLFSPSDLDPKLGAFDQVKSRWNANGMAHEGGKWWSRTSDWGRGRDQSRPDIAGGTLEEQDGWVDFDEGLDGTKYEGGVAGYQVFSNLYLFSGSLTAVRPSSPSSPESGSFDEEEEGEFARKDDLPFPETKYIISSSVRGVTAGQDRWQVEDPEVARSTFGKNGYKLGGVTFIFNDGPGSGGYLVYFKHFVGEAFLGAVRVLSSTFSLETQIPLVRRIWFPRCGVQPSWRDDRGENVWFLSRAVPSASIEDSTGWADRDTSDVTFLLEKVVIIDRWAAHSIGGDNGKWGKMSVLVPNVAAPSTFFEPYASNVITALSADSSSTIGSRGLPVVVYIDRQIASPRLVSEHHDALVQSLRSLTAIAEVHVIKYSSMTKKRQVEVMSRALVVIGLHSDDLLGALWMPSREGSTVIEFFEQGRFERDIELMSTSLNHRHIAIQNDRVLAEEEWRINGPSIGQGLVEVPVDAETVVRVVEDILSAKEQYAAFVQGTDEDLPADGELELEDIDAV